MDDLRKRVSGLTNTVELMNRTFVEYRDRVSLSGLPQSQLQELRDVSEQFETLMRSVRNPEEDDDLEIVQRDHVDQAHSLSTRRKSIEPQNVPSWMDKSTLSRGTRHRPPMEVGMGYTMFMQEPESLDSTDNFDFDVPSAPILDTSMLPKTPDFSSTDLFRAEILDSSPLPLQLSPLITFSFQEATFARRLHRSCLEHGYQLLFDPSKQPVSAERVFGLSSQGRERSKMMASIKAVLARGPHESLDIFQSPLIHVGGAGTHYPKRDQFGQWHAKTESFNLGTIGPQTLALLQSAARENLTTDMTVNIIGYEGEWFDPSDVEGYLAEKDIFIDPSASFAEAEVLECSPRSGSNASTISSAADSPVTLPNLFSPREVAIPFDGEQLQELNRMQVNVNEYNDCSTLHPTGFLNSGIGPWKTALLPGDDPEADHLFDAATPDLACGKGPHRMKRIVIDVSKFVSSKFFSTLNLNESSRVNSFLQS